LPLQQASPGVEVEGSATVEGGGERGDQAGGVQAGFALDSAARVHAAGRLKEARSYLRRETTGKYAGPGGATLPGRAFPACSNPRKPPCPARPSGLRRTKPPA